MNATTEEGYLLDTSVASAVFDKGNPDHSAIRENLEQFGVNSVARKQPSGISSTIKPYLELPGRKDLRCSLCPVKACEKCSYKRFTEKGIN